MSSGEDGVGVEDNTTAEVRATRRQGDNVGELGSGSDGATDDAVTLVALASVEAERLGGGRGHGSHGHGQEKSDSHVGSHLCGGKE